jgi:peroxiredoxin Q/BCP
VKVGARVPALTTVQSDGSEWRLAEHAGGKVVLYFYPKDATPGCTLEGRDFRDLHAAFRRARTAVFGVSRDSCASHAKFRAKERFPFELLADTDEALCRAFDVIAEKNMYGRKVMGIVRSTFLIGADGRLAAEWRKVKVDGHAGEVLEAAKRL